MPAATRDGETIRLQANLEFPREVGQAVAAGAEGVGLLRTEFLYMNRDDLPSENEQYDALMQIVEGMPGKTITVRTLDVGGEKLATSFSDVVAESTNPALGLRAIRLSLKEPKLLDTQLAAILRAGAHGQLRILLPMITTGSEVSSVRKQLIKAAAALDPPGREDRRPAASGGRHDRSAGRRALGRCARSLVGLFRHRHQRPHHVHAGHRRRGEEQVAHLYNPLHPAVLRLIQFTVEAALRARIPISICGEIAGDPRFTALLVGLGVRELSMTTNALPRVKSRILGLDLQEATRRASVIMDQSDSGRITALLDDFNALA